MTRSARDPDVRLRLPRGGAVSRMIPERQWKELDFPYCYFAHAIDPQGDVDHFHYGLWEQGTRGIKEAQENMTRLLLSLIPRGIATILDVGCGLGTTAVTLARTGGYTVVGISPDRRLMELARLRHGDPENPRFVIASLDQFSCDWPFDLILFQESVQYIPALELFSKCRTLVRPGGYLLMGDEFVYRQRNEFPFLPVKSELMAASRQAGFRLVLNEAITRQVLPTLDFGIRVLDRKDELLEAFRGYRPKAAEELDELDRGWRTYRGLYEAGELGYEIFLFRRRRDLKALWAEVAVGAMRGGSRR